MLTSFVSPSLQSFFVVDDGWQKPISAKIKTMFKAGMKKIRELQGQVHLPKKRITTADFNRSYFG